MDALQFRDKYTGQIISYNGYAGECLSLAKRYIKDCFGIEPPSSGSNSAYGYWSNFPVPLGDVFDKIPFGSFPIVGDVVIWKPWSTNKYGHIDICVENGTQGGFWGFDANWQGKEAHSVYHNYDNVIGYLRPKESMDKFTVGQATRLYEVLAGREPERPEFVENKDWGLFEQLVQTEFEPRINAIVTELNNCKSNLTLNENAVKDLTGKLATANNIIGGLNGQIEDLKIVDNGKTTDINQLTTDKKKLQEDLGFALAELEELKSQECVNAEPKTPIEWLRGLLKSILGKE